MSPDPAWPGLHHLSRKVERTFQLFSSRYWESIFTCNSKFIITKKHSTYHLILISPGFMRFLCLLVFIVSSQCRNAETTHAPQAMGLLILHCLRSRSRDILLWQIHAKCIPSWVRHGCNSYIHLSTPKVKTAFSWWRKIKNKGFL